MRMDILAALGAVALAALAFSIAYRRGGTDASAIIPLALSLLAVSISGLTLYYGYLARFYPLITVGTVIFHPNREGIVQAGSDPSKNTVTRHAAILVPFVFTHRGGNAGVIEDVMVRLARKDGAAAWLAEPVMFLNEREYLQAGAKQSPDAIWMESTFHPLPLAKGAQLERFILFRPAEGFAEFQGGGLVPGEYILSFLVKHSDAVGYREVEIRTENVSQKMLDDLAAGTRVGILPSTVAAARKRIRR